MPKLYITLTKKVIMLIIITVLPLGLYLYLNEEVQTTFITNIDTNQTKYILDAEFNPNDKSIYVYEKIIFSNKTNDKIDKIYFYLNNEIKIANIKINKKEVGYKIIGDENILMVTFSEEIQTEDSIDIDINFLIKAKDSSWSKEYDGTTNYKLGIWYPVVIYHDNNGWNLKSATNNTPQLLMSNHHIRILIPTSYSLDMSNTKNEGIKMKDNGEFFQITGEGITYLPFTIRKSYSRD